MKNPLELQMSAELASELAARAAELGVSIEELTEMLVRRALDQRNPIKRRGGRVVRINSKRRGAGNGDTSTND